MSVRLANARRFVPGARFDPSLWVTGVFCAVFYLYLFVVLVRFGEWWALARSPIALERLSATVIGAGLLLVYWVSILPQIGRDRSRGKIRDGALRRFQANRLAVVGLALFLVFVMVSIVAPIIAPFDPAAQSDPVAEQYQGPSRIHLMGTDKFGRDVCSRVLFGSQTSLAVGLLASVMASIIGLALGAFSGYAGGRADDLIMRIVDGFLAFPRLLLVLTALAFFANSFWVVVLLLALTGWMDVSRLVRAEVLRLKEQEFVQAAVATGAGRTRVLWKHLVPNALGPVVTSATLRIGTIILLESYLSFLGLGLQPPTASWGGMVLAGREVLLSAWWVSMFPGLAIVSAVMACNLIGDGLRDALDTRG